MRRVVAATLSSSEAFSCSRSSSLACTVQRGGRGSEALPTSAQPRRPLHKIRLLRSLLRLPLCSPPEPSRAVMPQALTCMPANRRAATPVAPSPSPPSSPPPPPPSMLSTRSRKSRSVCRRFSCSSRSCAARRAACRGVGSCPPGGPNVLIPSQSPQFPVRPSVRGSPNLSKVRPPPILVWWFLHHWPPARAVCCCVGRDSEPSRQGPRAAVSDASGDSAQQTRTTSRSRTHACTRPTSCATAAAARHARHTCAWSASSDGPPVWPPLPPTPLAPPRRAADSSADSRAHSPLSVATCGGGRGRHAEGRHACE
jgi:hypothetical protein